MFLQKLSIIVAALSLCALINSNFVYSQDREFNKQDLSQLNNIDIRASVFPTKSSTKKIGSPYLNDNFLKGHIITNSNSNTEVIYLRFNILKNEVEFLRNDQLYVTDPSKISGFKIYSSDGGILFKNGFSSNKYDIQAQKFLRIVKQEGKLLLLANHKTSLIKDLASYGTATKTDKYTAKIVYYLLYKDEFMKINTNRNTVEGTEAPIKRELNNYIKTNNLNVGQEKNLMKVFQFVKDYSD